MAEFRNSWRISVSVSAINVADRRTSYIEHRTQSNLTSSPQKSLSRICDLSCMALKAVALGVVSPDLS